MPASSAKPARKDRAQHVRRNALRKGLREGKSHLGLIGDEAQRKSVESQHRKRSACADKLWLLPHGV